MICKKLAIKKIFRLEDGEPAAMEESISELKLRDQVEKQMSYGDIAWIATGKKGLALVNFALVYTQFGFCVGYFIFLGNTIQKLFPLVNGTMPVPVNTTQVIGGVLNDLSTLPPPSSNLTNSSHLGPSLHHTGPASMFYIIVACFVPAFVAFAFLRSIRHMGPASLFANVASIIGYATVMGYILSGNHKQVVNNFI